jgi:anti-anti-sigma regulatory factor
MEITTDRLDGGTVALLALEGELDASNFEDLIAAARRATADRPRLLVLDLSGVPYIGSSGLVALHSAAMLMRGKEPPSAEDGWSALHDVGRDAADDAPEAVAVVAPQPPVQRVLDRSGMSRIFRIYPDRKSAIDASQQPSA